jgi:hypothetical protein
MTDDLIESLALDLRPVRRFTVARGLLAAAIVALVVSSVLMLTLLGPRPDMSYAMGTAIFWIKFFYALSIGLAGTYAVSRLARPGVPARRPIGIAAGIVIVLVVLAAIELGLASPEARRAMMMGSSALLCPVYIFGLSLPFLVANIALLRRLAPTSLTLTGFAAGLMAGGLGATIYGFHCTEEAMPFLAIWYTLGIAMVAALGAAIGRWALRW